MRQHNRRMKIVPRFYVRAHPGKTLCLAAAGLLLLLWVCELAIGDGDRTGIWFGAALCSAYLTVCLGQRRQYFPSSRWAIKPRRYNQLPR
jgi:hypothetical protein